MLHSFSTFRRHFGFSLVELLVVISIVAVLLAVLLPSITTARAYARQSVCASNLRQQGIATTAYCMSQRDGAFPYHGRFYATWMIQIAPYMGWAGSVEMSGHTTLDGQLDQRNNLSNSVDARIKAYQCPERAFRLRQTGTAEYYYDYGMNHTLRNGRQGDTGSLPAAYWPYRRTLHQITTNPSNIVLVGDGTVGSPLDWNELTSNSTNDLTRRFHVEKGRVNFLFVDGHAASFLKGQATNLQWFDLLTPSGPISQPNLGW